MTSQFNTLYALDLLGTAAFAASGALAAVRKKMDLFGVIVLGIVTATGGGVLRDLLLGDAPPFCFKNELYLYLAVITSIIVFLSPRRFERMGRAMLFLDALGLGTFLVIGTSKALAFHLGFAGSVIMGVMTGTFGGLIRDTLSNEIPLILQREIYASACVVGGACFYFLNDTFVPPAINLTVSALVVILIRGAAIAKGWHLPRA
ncbi:trimeric intracellular cation channel family protein [Geomesophilobacter sediminis]|uniref:Trimeric intracellular cation channel family protein n=1 Tax=Geomesophilobacter sediminis TaxID=2798584 RepID=A0A8J7M348_9BACT|nr:trimeric intracellular cation channel family protein [Geomesophilobacter sediminis]MBJ6727835.1 trimeric intracellular cation channel family protein [Geomesophilobacter sediminis]